MKQVYLLTCLVITVSTTAVLHAATSAEGIWAKDGSYVVPWENMPIENKTFALEKYRDELAYCLENLGKSFKEIDPVRANSKAYELEVGYVTYGLIGSKYIQYGDYKRAAEYKYKDYLQAWKCSKESVRIKPDCWGGSLGEGHLLAPIINTFEMNNDYQGALPYYRMWLEGWAIGYEGKTLEEKLKSLKVKASKDENLASAVELIDDWEKAKKLAKTEKPIPMDPAVQNHELFYSNKTAETLKALDYYNKNKVKFMVEKAVKHNNPVIARKANQYLDNWDKQSVEEKK